MRSYRGQPPIVIGAALRGVGRVATEKAVTPDLSRENSRDEYTAHKDAEDVALRDVVAPLNCSVAELAPSPRVHVDDVSERCERLTARRVVVPGQSLEAMRIVSEFDARHALFLRNRLLACPAPPLAVRAFIER